MLRKVLIPLACAALVAVPTAGAAAQPAPLPPQAAQAAASAVQTVTPGPAPHRITPDEALAAAKIPGAVVEIAPGLTLRQAVGLAPVRRLARRLGTTVCWNNSDQWYWGDWPYDRHLWDTTSWCGSGGTLTYRSSHSSQTQNICSPNGMYGFKLAGGVGSSYVAWRDGGNWTCPTDIPWFTLYFDDWMDVYVNGSGLYWIYEASSP